MSRPTRPTGDGGFAGGVEGIVFGVLVCALTVLLASSVWGVSRGRIAAESAAREGARAYVEADGAPEAAARQAVAAVLTARGRDLARARVVVTAEAFARCRRVVVEVAYDVAGPRTVTVRGRHSELVDPFRDGVPDEAVCA